MKTIEVLNTGAGHLDLKWNPDIPEDVTRARKLILDMMMKGYVLLLPGEDGAMTRVGREAMTRLSS